MLVRKNQKFLAELKKVYNYPQHENIKTIDTVLHSQYKPGGF